MRRTFPYPALLLFLAACAVGANTTPTSGNQPMTAQLSIVLHVPDGSVSSRAKYISTSTQGIGISVAASPTSFPAAATPQNAFNVGSSSPFCTGSGSARMCTLTIPATVGTVDAQITAWDQAPVSGSFTGANRLSGAVVTNQTVSLGVANTLNVTLDGAVASIALSLSTATFSAGPTATYGGTPQTSTLTALVKDADGNVILGSGNYTDTSGNALTISIVQSTTTSGDTVRTTLSSTAVTPSTNTFTVTYPGGGTYGTIFTATPTHSITGTNVAATLTVTPTVTEYALPTGSLASGLAPGPDGNIWVTELSGTTRIAKVTPSGAITQVATSPTPPNPSFFDVTFAGDGNAWLGSNSADGISKMTTAGALTEYAVAGPGAITLGPDGNIWYTRQSSTQSIVGKMTTSGSDTEYILSSSSDHPSQLTSGPDGNVWFEAGNVQEIGQITTSGTVTMFPSGVSSSGGMQNGIVSGPDGALWFTNYVYNSSTFSSSADQIGRITTGGTVTEFPVTTASEPAFITSGPDGNLWFTEAHNRKIGRLTTSGTLTEFSTTNFTYRICVGPDGNLWFTEISPSTLGRLIY